jgi:hypothetical protein
MLDSEFWQELADRFRALPNFPEALHAVWLAYSLEDHTDFDPDGEVEPDPTPYTFWEVRGHAEVTQQFDPLARRGGDRLTKGDIVDSLQAWLSRICQERINLEPALDPTYINIPHGTTIKYLNQASATLCDRLHSIAVERERAARAARVQALQRSEVASPNRFPDSPLPLLTPGDPRNRLSKDARRRVQEAHRQADLVRMEHHAQIEAEEVELGSKEERIGRNKANLAAARAVLRVLSEEYGTLAGITGSEYRSYMRSEIEGCANSLELQVSQRRLLEIEFERPVTQQKSGTAEVPEVFPRRIEDKPEEVPAVIADSDSAQSESHEVISPPAKSSIGAQLTELRDECRISTERLAELVEIDPATAWRHLSGSARPQLPTIGAYERVFSKLLGRKVRIEISPRKRK